MLRAYLGHRSLTSANRKSEVDKMTKWLTSEAVNKMAALRHLLGTDLCVVFPPPQSMAAREQMGRFACPTRYQEPCIFIIIGELKDDMLIRYSLFFRLLTSCRCRFAGLPGGHGTTESPVSLVKVYSEISKGF